PALGKPVREVWGDVWHLIEGDVPRILAGETIFNEAVERPLKRDGEVRTAWLSVCYTPVRDETGGVAGIFAVVTSGNEDRDEAERLRESEQCFRLIAHSAPVPM